MTFPAMATMLGRIGSDPGVLAVGWWHGGHLAGLALCRVLPEEVQLGSVFVKRAVQGRGIGRQLVTAVEVEARRRGSRRITVAYSTAVPGWRPLESVLRHLGWDSPAPRMEMLFTTRRQLADLMYQPLYRHYRRPRFPMGSRLVAWRDLSPDMTAAIAGDAAVSADGAPVEPLTSFGVVAGNTLQCGLLTHRVSSDMIRYCRAHVTPSAQNRRGILVQLFAHAFWRHAEAGPDRGCFAVFHDNASLLAVIHRRMVIPGAISARAQSRISVKSLF